MLHVNVTLLCLIFLIIFAAAIGKGHFIGVVGGDGAYF